MRLDSSLLVNKHKDCPIIIIGNAYSLTTISLEKLDNFITIGCNRIVKIYHPTYYICADRRPFQQYREQIKRSKSIKLLATRMFSPNNISERRRDYPLKEPAFDWYPFSTQQTFRDYYSKPDELLVPKNFTSALETSGNIAPPTLLSAIIMGGSPIGMLGFDMEWESPDRSHFWGKGTDEGSFRFKGDRIARALHAISVVAQKRGVDIVNLSPHRGLMDNYFPHYDFEEFPNKKIPAITPLKQNLSIKEQRAVRAHKVVTRCKQEIQRNNHMRKQVSQSRIQASRRRSASIKAVKMEILRRKKR